MRETLTLETLEGEAMFTWDGDSVEISLEDYSHWDQLTVSQARQLAEWILENVDD